jgi:NAD(P)-dependent dehydrogenase (short-subunit alcohol dehydrogenase family)
VSDLAAVAATATTDAINRACDAGGAIAARVDVTREESVRALVRMATDSLGTPEILVNNAGVLFGTRIGDISLAEWNLVMATNLTGSFLCAREVLPGMRARQRGHIVNMSSSAGRSVSTLGGAHYTAAKAGVLGLTRAIAKEVAADGILVNAVCPGLIDTEMVRSHCTTENLRTYERSFPIRRLGTVTEVADVVTFLCSCASYVTGASIDVNGGDLMI